MIAYRSGASWEEIGQLYPGSRHSIRQAASSRGYARTTRCRHCSRPAPTGQALCSACATGLLIEYARSGAVSASRAYGVSHKTADSIVRRSLDG